MSSRCLYNIIKDIIIKAIGSAGMLVIAFTLVAASLYGCPALMCHYI